MNYAIEILKKKSEEHKKALDESIKKMEEGDFELTSDIHFLESDIENQRNRLQHLLNAINVLIIHKEKHGVI